MTSITPAKKVESGLYQFTVRIMDDNYSLLRARPFTARRLAGLKTWYLYAGARSKAEILNGPDTIRITRSLRDAMIQAVELTR